jgi:DNA-binding Lrp family transcriptional regulator
MDTSVKSNGASINMDKKDREIIRELQADGRMSNQELAAKVNLSPSPCLRRLRNLEAQGVIKSYGVEVDEQAYGLPITVFARVQLEKHSADIVSNFEQHIEFAEQVLECYVMTGVSDYLLKIVVADLHDYEVFVRKVLHPIGSIASIDTSFAYGTVKKTGVFPAI